MFVAFQILFTGAWALAFLVVAIIQAGHAKKSTKVADWKIVVVYVFLSLLGLFATYTNLAHSD